MSAACDEDTSNENAERGESHAGHDAGADASAASKQSLHISITVPNVPPGTEGTQCLKVRLGNEQAVKINKIHNRLFGHSHHFVLSSVTDPSAEEQGLFECPPFRAPLTGAPLTVTQKQDETIVLPKGVGYSLEANQLMHLELHYINTSDKTEDIRAEAELFPSQESGTIEEAGFLIVGSLNIKIPPNSKHSTGDLYMAVPDAFEGKRFYAVTGHTHQLGTNVSVGIAPSSTGEATPVYDPSSFDWSAPEVRYLDPPREVPVGGGFRFRCDWNNTTDQTVLYGESALTEMCFFWAYYYPKLPTQQTLLGGLETSMYADAGTGSGR